jgi:hypothetical protein
MKAPVKSIEERKQEFLANPQAQAIIKRKVDNAIKFFETADLSALSKNRKKD